MKQLSERSVLLHWLFLTLIMSAAHADPHETSSLSKERVKVGVIGGELQTPPMTFSMLCLTPHRRIPHHCATGIAVAPSTTSRTLCSPGQQAYHECLYNISRSLLPRTAGVSRMPHRWSHPTRDLTGC